MTTGDLLQRHRFEGDRDGPKLLITAGVHGDEYLPMLAVRELIRRFESGGGIGSSLRGSLSMVPIVNRPAYIRGHRCGDDNQDLARCCPGSADGTTTERIAHALSREIAEADFYIDLHTGGTELSVWPLAGYVLHAERTILDQQRKMAQAFQLPLAWGTSAGLQGRSLSVARDCNVPAIYVEYFGAHRELAEVATFHEQDTDHPLVEGCLNVMRHLGVIDGAPPMDIEPETIEDWREESGHMQVCNPAPATGFLIPKVELGQTVSVGDVLAEIDSVDDQVRHRVVSQQAGKVVVIRQCPRIRQGDAVAVVAENSGES